MTLLKWWMCVLYTICIFLWPPASYAGRRPLFCHCSLDLLFSLPNFQGRLADHHQTLPHVLWWPRFIKFAHKFGWLLPCEIWRPKNVNILAQFWATLRPDCEYLWNTTRHRQSENSVANYGHSHTGKRNLVYFGPQTAKIGSSSDPHNGWLSGWALPCI